MEDVLGKRTDSQLFEAFLDDWEAILERRVGRAVETIATVPGVHGLILAGSGGRGESWPLSDIDLLPIYDDKRLSTVQAEIARRRQDLLGQWADEGWWTGLDIENLVFGHSEVERVIEPREPEIERTLRDDRWYHAVDKGYEGRPVYDPEGLAATLARWLTERRFSPSVVALRLRREQTEIDRALDTVRRSTGQQDVLEAARALHRAVAWLRIWFLESWGERDNSLGRLGTRFERLAVARGAQDVAHALNVAAGLDDDSLPQRMSLAPDWV